MTSSTEEERLIQRIKDAARMEDKQAALVVLRAFRERREYIKKFGSEEAADAAIEARNAKLAADKIRSRERELAACGDRRALHLQVQPLEQTHRTSQTIASQSID
jgi:hypothetical protein